MQQPVGLMSACIDRHAGGNRGFIEGFEADIQQFADGVPARAVKFFQVGLTVPDAQGACSIRLLLFSSPQPGTVGRAMPTLTNVAQGHQPHQPPGNRFAFELGQRCRRHWQRVTMMAIEQPAGQIADEWLVGDQ